MARFRLVAPALILLLAAACAATEKESPPQPDTGIDVAGIVIRNSLNYTVRDVLVQVPATGGFVGCGNILPRTECKTSFPSVDYRKNALIVTWSEHGEAQGTDEFIAELPAGAATGDSVWLEVVIYAPGLAGARFVQP